jgi:ADP-sugar diphosphatase
MRGKTIEPTFQDHIPEEGRRAIGKASHFTRWIDRITCELDVRSVTVRDVVMFGSRAGFILVETEAYGEDGRRVPGVAMLRGDAVAVLLVAHLPDGSRLAVLTRQARVPVGSSAFHEIPAGMLDDGVFASKALEEIAEEVGEDLKVREEDLRLVGDFHPSPGGVDESVRIYVADIQVDHETAASLASRRTGNVHENESITVVTADLAEARRLVSTDMKSMLALLSYGI